MHRNRPPKEKPTLENILKKPYAKEAFDKLVSLKATASSLEYWLLALAKGEYTNASAVKWRRQAGTLPKRALRLAKDTSDAINFRGCPVTATESQKEEIGVALQVLLNLADTWQEILSWRRKSRGPGKDNELIILLLHSVEVQTGSYYYKEVADLVNAAFSVRGLGPDRDLHVENLMKMAARHRKIQRFDLRPPRGL